MPSVIYHLDRAGREVRYVECTRCGATLAGERTPDGFARHAAAHLAICRGPAVDRDDLRAARTDLARCPDLEVTTYRLLVRLLDRFEAEMDAAADAGRPPPEIA